MNKWRNWENNIEYALNAIIHISTVIKEQSNKFSAVQIPREPDKYNSLNKSRREAR